MGLGVANVLGDLIGAGAQGYFGRESAKDQMAFQERMANTQYQRAAKDLEAAGLNRIIALGSPAAAPSGASASIEAPALGRSYVQGETAKSQIDLQKQQQKLLDSQIANTDADTRKKEVETANLGFAGQETISRTEANQAGIPLTEANIGLTNASVDRIRTEIPRILAETRLTNANASEAEFKKIFYEKLEPMLQQLLDSLLPSKENSAKGIGSVVQAIREWWSNMAGDILDADVQYRQFRRSRGLSR